MSEIKRSTRKRNLFGLQRAPITVNNETDYAAGEKTDIKGVIAMKLTDNFESEPFYSDGGTEETIVQFVDGDGEMEISALSPPDRQFLLDQVFKDGFLVKSSDDRPQEQALSFISEAANGLLEFTQLYCVIFNQGDEISYNTKTNKIETSTNTLNFKYYERKKTNVINEKRKHLYELVIDEEHLVPENTSAKAAIEAWMKTVPEPIYKDGPPPVVVPLTVVSEIPGESQTEVGYTKITVTPVKAVGNTYKYKTDTTLELPVKGTVPVGYTEWDGSAFVQATHGNEIVIAEISSGDTVVRSGKATVVANQ